MAKCNLLETQSNDTKKTHIASSPQENSLLYSVFTKVPVRHHSSAIIGTFLQKMNKFFTRRLVLHVTHSYM